MDFEKLFRFDDVGQVLVKLDDGEDKAHTIVTEVLKTIPSSLADLCEED